MCSQSWAFPTSTVYPTPFRSRHHTSCITTQHVKLSHIIWWALRERKTKHLGFLFKNINKNNQQMWLEMCSVVILNREWHLPGAQNECHAGGRQWHHKADWFTRLRCNCSWLELNTDQWSPRACPPPLVDRVEKTGSWITETAWCLSLGRKRFQISVHGFVATWPERHTFPHHILWQSVEGKGERLIYKCEKLVATK